MNFLAEHGTDTYPDLERKVAEITAASDEIAASLKAAELRLADMAVLIKNVTTYKQLRPVALEYRKAADKAKFRREHESTLILYEAAAKALKEQSVKKLPDLYALKAEYKRLAEEKERQYRKARKLVRECCNYCDGNCLLLDDGEECVCVQSISYSLLCRWFRAAVLPLDAALYAEITKDRDEVKRCCECGVAFMPKSNRAKYCPACAKLMRRRKEAERQRKRYWQSTHLGP